MKKLLIAATLVLTSLSGYAQIIRSTTSEVSLAPKPVAEKTWNHSGFLVETGIGLLTGDADTDFAWEVGWGYRWHIIEGFSWEIFKIGFNAGVSHFSDTFCLRFTTGLRYDTPRFDFLKDRSMYVNFNAGYGVRTSDYAGDGGFAWELGAGVKLTRKCSVGLFYQADSDKYTYSDYGYDDSVTANWGMVGVRIEYQFR